MKRKQRMVAEGVKATQEQQKKEYDATWRDHYNQKGDAPLDW